MAVVRWKRLMPCPGEGTCFWGHSSAARTRTALFPQLPSCFPLPCKILLCCQYPAFLFSTLGWRGDRAAKGKSWGETAPPGTSSHPTSPLYITTNSSSPSKLKQIPNSWRRWTHGELLGWSFTAGVAEKILPALQSHRPHWLEVNIGFVKPCKTCFSSDKMFLSPHPCIKKRHWNMCSPTTHCNFPFPAKKWKVFLVLADSWTCSEAILLSSW